MRKESKKQNKTKPNIPKELVEKLKGQEIISCHQFDEFEFLSPGKEGAGLSETNIIVFEKEDLDKDGENIIIYEFYKDGQRIASTNEKGEIIFEAAYKQLLKEQYKEYYELLKLEDRDPSTLTNQEFQKKLEQVKKQEERNSKSDEKQDNKKEDENQKNEINPREAEEQLGLAEGDIEACTNIVDKRFYDKVPEAREYDGYAMLAYSKSRNEFIIIGKDNGKIVEAQTITPGKGTMKTSIDLDNDGNPVERQSINAIMQIKGGNEYDFAVNFDTAGIIEFQELRWDPVSKQYMSSDLETIGDINQRTTKEVEDMMKKSENDDIIKEVKKYEKATSDDEVVNIKDIDDLTDEEKEEENEEQNESEIDDDDDGPPMADPFNPNIRSRS